MASTSLTELLESLLQELRPWLVVWTPWNEKLLLVASLQAVPQHWSVNFFEDVRADFDMQVGANAEDVPVKRGVVDLAECESVRHDWLAPGMAVRQNVCGVQKFGVPEPADGTRRAVGNQDPLAELGLMDSNEPFLGDVGASRLGAGFDQLVATQALFSIKADSEGEGSWIVSLHERRPHREVLTY